MATRHTVRYSMALVIRELQLKTTVRYSSTPTREAVIPNTAQRDQLTNIWFPMEKLGFLFTAERKWNSSANMQLTVWASNSIPIMNLREPN